MRDGSGRGRFRLKMPPPSGGLDATQEPDGIGEDRLADSVNLWWERGALRTRPGLYSTAERRTALHTTVEASDTYAFGGVQTTGHRSMVGGVPTETVLESFTDSGGAHIEAVRIGADGTAYLVRDDEAALRVFAAHAGESDLEYTAAIASDTALWGEDLTCYENFVQTVADWAGMLRADPQAALARVLED